jgi:ATP-dependent DNA helicase RecQ
VGVFSVLLKDPKTELFRRFGHRDFRKGQEECVTAALKGNDVYCLMPTGGGKSIVYQLPAWCDRGLSIVFSPLISLIQDQVDAMNAIGIR